MAHSSIFNLIFMIISIPLFSMQSSADPYLLDQKEGLIKRTVKADDFGKDEMASLVRAAFSPDGQKVLVVTNCYIENVGTFWRSSPVMALGGKDTLWIVDIISHEKKKIFSEKSQSFFAKWSPNGQKVYISYNPHASLRIHNEANIEKQQKLSGKLICYDISSAKLEEVLGLDNYYGADFLLDAQEKRIYYIAAVNVKSAREKPPHGGPTPLPTDSEIIVYNGYNPYDYYSASREYRLSVYDRQTKKNSVLARESNLIKNLILCSKENRLYYEVSAIDIPTENSSRDISLVKFLDFETMQTGSPYTGQGFVGLYDLSPDEGKLACYVDFHHKIRFWGPTELGIITLGTGDIKVIPLEFNLTDGKCHWSKDGRFLFTGGNSAKGKNLVRIDTQSGHISPLTNSRTSLFQYHDQSSDGRYILFSEISRSRHELFRSLTDGTQKEQILVVDNPSFEGRFRLGNVEVVSWTSMDGLSVAGILTYPVDYTQDKSYPLVVTLHGGPFPGFCFMSMTQQFLAGLGYAVLQVEYRTSGSYGYKNANTHLDGPYGQATGDLMDIKSGVDAMIKRKIADPDCIGIIGHSNGSYLTNWAVSTCDTFRAAVSYEGGFNLGIVAERAALQGLFQGHYVQEEAWGGTIEAAEKTWLNSSYRKMYDIITPILFFHGEDGIEFKDSLIGWWTLKRKRIPSDFVLYNKEGHVIQKPKNQQDFASRVQGWFELFLRNLE